MCETACQDVAECKTAALRLSPHAPTLYYGQLQAVPHSANWHQTSSRHGNRATIGCLLMYKLSSVQKRLFCSGTERDLSMLNSEIQGISN